MNLTSLAIQLALVLMVAGGATWGVHRYNESIRLEEAQRQEARLTALKQEAVAAIEAANRAGLEEARKLNSQLIQSVGKLQAAQQIVTTKRMEESNAQAKVDPSYQAWAASPPPSFVSDRIRLHELAFKESISRYRAAETVGAGDLPSGVNVVPPQLGKTWRDWLHLNPAHPR